MIPDNKNTNNDCGMPNKSYPKKLHETEFHDKSLNTKKSEAHERRFAKFDLTGQNDDSNKICDETIPISQKRKQKEEDT